MKALLERFKKKEKEKFLSPPLDPETNFSSSRDREKLGLPPLRPWPPPSQTQLDPSPNSLSKPLPPIDQSPIISHTNSQASSDSRSSARTSVPAPSPALPASRVSSSDDRGAINTTTTVTRTEALRHDSIDAASAAVSQQKARKAAEANSPPDSTQHKKVAFISPPPTPAPIERALSNQSEPGRTNGVDPSLSDGGQAKAPVGGNITNNGDAVPRTPPGPLKTNVSRFQAMHSSETRGTGNASSSRVNVSKGGNGSSIKGTAAASRTTVSPNSQRNFADNMSLNASVRSGTPYSQASQSSSRILATASWSEAAEGDLVSNLGPRERTRQEVLWEIVASEERYVLELTKLKETFIEPLLHPYAAPPICSPTPLESDEYFAHVESPRESIDHLPIAARFLSPTPGLRPETPTTTKGNGRNADNDSPDSDDDEAQDQIGTGYSSTQGRTKQRNGKTNSAVAAAIAKFNHPRSPYNTAAQRSRPGKVPLSFPSRSHQSLPPPPRVPPQGSTASLGRQSIYGAVPEREREVSYAATQQTDKTDKSSASRVLKKLRRNTPQRESLIGDSVPPNQLPEDLRKCLEVVEEGIFNGHITLSEGLRKRYEEQYPLVRSLADVFVSNSHILREYATYVLHLERALEQVDNALSTASDKKKPKNQDSAIWVKVCKTLQKLEQDAVEKGETGLAISLSKPFQRLLKYPLLFQNLLYHTDPSTFEYESTLQMVAEVENIVRSIEDEKIQKEERDRTRDALARIEGLEKVKQLALPKPSRLLVEERPLVPPQTQSQPAPRSPPVAVNNVMSKNVRGKSSFRRLSDVLNQSSHNGVGGKKDLWLVKFNDVELRCQRTGITTLPLASSTNARTNSLPDLQSKAKYASTGRKSAHTKPRNLYKFIRIENWALADVPGLKEGVVAMDDVVRSRNTVISSAPTGRSSVMPEDDDDDGDSSDSDRKSKMSFSYWGADKVTIHKPITPKGRVNATTNRKGALTPLGYSRESSANAKFGTRLVASPEPHMHHRDYHPPTRPASRRTQGTPSSRRVGHSEDGHASAKSTVTSATATRPAWDASTRSAGTTTPTSARTRTRLLSQTSSRTPASVAAANNKMLASPAPSEDSGVGLYRQLMAQDSQLNVL